MPAIGKLLLGGGAVAVAIVLFFILKPEDESDAMGTTTGADTIQTQAEGTTTRATTTSRETGPVRVNIRVRGGTVPDVKRVTVKQGRAVVIVVTADVEDEVHLHGYDLMRDVAPDEPARIAFRATAPGRFEVELEDRKLPLAEIEVEP